MLRKLKKIICLTPDNAEVCNVKWGNITDSLKSVERRFDDGSQRMQRIENELKALNRNLQLVSMSQHNTVDALQTLMAREEGMFAELLRDVKRALGAVHHGG